MKKLIPIIIVEDTCEKCPYSNYDDYGDYICYHPKQQSDYPQVSNNNGFINIPDWCPLETVEE